VNGYLSHVCSGYSHWTVAAYKGWKVLLTGVILAGWMADVEKKIFKPKYELPLLDDYNSPIEGQYWRQFPENKAVIGKSRINHERLLELAHTYGCEDWDRLFRVCQDIRYGADIGCTGIGRMPTVARNAKSAVKFGQQVSDAVADWLEKGFAAGPFLEEQVPEGAKINSILCREKPNGAVRIILNLSAPEGISVNDGINKEDFPAIMSSTNMWLEVLHKAGQGAWIMKVDWSDAYKHLHVRRQDLDLQWFSWLGRYFQELCLIFGSASSPGLYDRMAKTALDLILRKAKFPKDYVCQHLDDTAAACPADSDALVAFDEVYTEVAEYLGIKLAPRDDPEKAFKPSKSGIVFGISYDTVNWTWGLPKDKLQRLANQIRWITEQHSVRQDEIQSVVGRIIHIKPLVPEGRFHVDHLMRLNNVSTRKDEHIPLDAHFKRQLYFWYIIVATCNNKAGIPAPETVAAPWAVQCYTDAAGGSLEGPGKGAGAVIPELGWWAYMPWSRSINDGSWQVQGKKVSRKLAALELIGPLITITTASEQLYGKPIIFWVDNQGSCAIWAHGYSNTCALSTTIVKAIATVASALGCRVHIKKIRRCSDPGASMADALSQADFYKFKQLGGDQLQAEPARIPLTLMKWCVKPTPDDDLGGKLLRELATKQPILGYNVGHSL